MLFCLNSSSVKNTAFREIYGISTGYLRDMFEQHLPLLKPFAHGRFKRFTGYVGGFYKLSLFFQKKLIGQECLIMKEIRIIIIIIPEILFEREYYFQRKYKE